MADVKIKMTDDEIIQLVEPDIDRAKSFQYELSKERYKAYRLYRFEKLGNERDGFSQVVDSVAWNTIEWLVPNIVDIFTGDMLRLTSDNEERAKRLKKFINYLLFRKQDGEAIFEDVAKNAALYHYGIFKCYYKEDYDFETKVFDELDQQSFAALLQHPEVTVSTYSEEIVRAEEIDPLTGLARVDPMTGGPVESVVSHVFRDVKAVRRKLKFQGPCTEAVPPWELYYIPGYATLDETPFVAHRVKRNLDYIRKQEVAGRYKKGSTEKCKEHIDNRREDIDTNQEQQQTYWVEGLTSPDETGFSNDWNEKERLGQNEVWVWECYLNLDVDKDGLLERCIVTVCEDVVLQGPVINPYDCIPFLPAYLQKEPFKLEGPSLPLLLEDEQKEQTNIRRLIVDSGAESAYRTMVTDSAQMAKQWSERTIGGTIIGRPDQIREVAVNPPAQYLLRAYELADSRIQNKTGITSYNQGLNADSLNKTATGVTAIMSASQIRMRSMARRFARAIRELIRRYIKIIQLYPPVDMMRAAGGEIEIDQSDLDGRFDVEIDVGVGPQEKQQAAMMMDQHIALLTNALIPAGIADASHLVRAVQRKYELLGVNARDLMPSVEEVMQKMQMAAQQGDPILQLDQMIKAQSAQGVPPQDIGIQLIEQIGAMSNEREQGSTPQAGGQGGGRRPNPDQRGLPAGGGGV